MASQWITLLNSGHLVTWQQYVWNTPTIQDFPTEKTMSHMFRSATGIPQVKRQNTIHTALMTINPEACKSECSSQQYPLQRQQGSSSWRYTNHFPFLLAYTRSQHSPFTTANTTGLPPLQQKCHEILQYKHALLAQKSDTMKILHLELG